MVVVLVQVTPLRVPPRVDPPPKWDIARFHLGSASHPSNFSPIAIIGKSLFFDPYKQVVGITGKMKNALC